MKLIMHNFFGEMFSLKGAFNYSFRILIFMINFLKRTD